MPLSGAHAGADAVAACVLAAFDQLPPKRKPRPRCDAAREWAPLAGIVLAKDGSLSCVSLGTGMKCLPSSKLPLAHGNILHDWHAEVLAIRAFNRFLLDQCLLACAAPHVPSPFIRQRSIEERTEAEAQPFAIQDDVQIHMYCSEAPCGDASMELVMDAQEDATPWTSPAAGAPAPSSESSANAMAPDEIQQRADATISLALRGRSHFGHLGAVRCKPSRPDAPPTLSKSCTDKLALAQAKSLLSSLTSHLISPRNAYIQSLVMPTSQFVPLACERAFSRSGRLKGVTPEVVGKWKGGYRWQAFRVKGTQREFAWSRRAIRPHEKAIPSNMSALWTPAWQETLIGGVLQGRKQLDPRAASAICRRSMWKTAAEIAGILGLPVLVDVLRGPTYRDVKENQMSSHRKQVKEDVKKAGLEGWTKNTGDDDFRLTSS